MGHTRARRGLGCETPSLSRAGFERAGQRLDFVGPAIGERLDITDRGLERISEMGNLKTLDLRGCGGITDRGLAHLAGMNGLERLSSEDAAR